MTTVKFNGCTESDTCECINVKTSTRLVVNPLPPSPLPDSASPPIVPHPPHLSAVFQCFYSIDCVHYLVRINMTTLLSSVPHRGGHIDRHRSITTWHMMMDVRITSFLYVVMCTIPPCYISLICNKTDRLCTFCSDVLF